MLDSHTQCTAFITINGFCCELLDGSCCNIVRFLPASYDVAAQYEENLQPAVTLVDFCDGGMSSNKRTNIEKCICNVVE